MIHRRSSRTVRPADPARRRLTPLACAATLALVAGCQTTTVIDQHHEAPAVVRADESIVVLGRRHAVTHETEQDFIECVGKSLADAGGVNVIPEKTFLDALYPWFEVNTAPMDVRNLSRLLKNRSVARKFDELGVRYFVWIDGSTERTESSGSVSCAVGPGGGGCFGYASWSDEARYEASIWDLEGSTVSGRISAEAQGTSHMPAVVVPIPLLARVQATACKGIAQQLAGSIQVEAPATATMVAQEADGECAPARC